MADGRDKVDRLPPDIRKELERKILEKDYRDYAALEQWTKDQGHSISRSAINRHAHKLERAGSPAEIPASEKPPKRMGLQELENEKRYLAENLPRMASREKAVIAELERRYQGDDGNPGSHTQPGDSKAVKARQMDGVKAALLAGQPVNQVEANRRGWGLRVGSIVHRLRGQGWPVHTQRDHGNGMARYSLPEGWQPPKAAPDTKKPPRPSRDAAVASLP